MNEWILNMTGLERVFTFCAFIGILLFIVRLVLQAIGGQDAGDASDAADVGDVGDVGDLDHFGDTDLSFKFMSLHGITVFLVMFGLVGRALLVDSRTGNGVAIAGAFGAGVLALVAMAKIYMLMNRLQSSGNVDMKNAVGQEGTVYLTIPANGSGQIQVTVQGKMHVVDAIDKQAGELKTGERVVVTGVRGGNTLIVEKQESPDVPA
jgi:membrane protein implicated in regulation of membrane protease activity